MVEGLLSSRALGIIVDGVLHSSWPSSSACPERGVKKKAMQNGGFGADFGGPVCGACAANVCMRMDAPVCTHVCTHVSTCWLTVQTGVGCGV